MSILLMFSLVIGFSQFQTSTAFAADKVKRKDVGEDALTVKKEEKVIIDGGSAQKVSGENFPNQ